MVGLTGRKVSGGSQLPYQRFTFFSFFYEFHFFPKTWGGSDLSGPQWHDAIDCETLEQSFNSQELIFLIRD